MSFEIAPMPPKAWRVPRRPQPEYITLDKAFRMYTAFRFYRIKCYRARIHARPDFYLEIKAIDGEVMGAYCVTFDIFVELHRNSGLYRIY